MPTDVQLQQAVLAEFKWDPSVNAAHIGVTARAGVVTLSGHVESFSEKHAAETATRRVKGVKAVAQEIEVQLPFETRRGDDAIAAAAVSRLAWDASVPNNAVEVKIENGWVTLTGEVNWHYQREAAGKDVAGLFGVVGVSNEISIKSRLIVLNVSDNIRHALHRSWLLNPETISVSAEDGRVLLTGTVHSLHDREVAAAAAWAALGTTAVENEITVT